MDIYIRTRLKKVESLSDSREYKYSFIFLDPSLMGLLCPKLVIKKNEKEKQSISISLITLSSRKIGVRV